MNIDNIFSYFLGLGLVIFISCQNQYRNDQVLIPKDTLYNFHVHDSTKLVIRMSGVDHESSPDFHKGLQSLCFVTTSRLKKYPISITGNDVLIEKVDSIEGLFRFTPLDTVFLIQVWQNYDSNRVVFKTREKDKIKIEPLVGQTKIGTNSFHAKVQ